MKIKFNWGIAIIIVIILFFGSMAFRIWLSYQQDLNLVMEDYYPKGINFQQQIQKENNLNKLKQKPQIVLKGAHLLIIYPGSFKGHNLKGSILVYRPSDSKLDHKFEMNPDTTMIQMIDANQFISGKYQVKMDWEMDDTPYYMEKEIFVTNKENE